MGLFSRKNVDPHVVINRHTGEFNALMRSLKNGYPHTTPESRRNAALELIELRLSGMSERDPTYIEIRRIVTKRLADENACADTEADLPKFSDWIRGDA